MLAPAPTKVAVMAGTRRRRCCLEGGQGGGAPGRFAREEQKVADATLPVARPQSGYPAPQLRSRLPPAVVPSLRRCFCPGRGPRQRFERTFEVRQHCVLEGRVRSSALACRPARGASRGRRGATVSCCLGCWVSAGEAAVAVTSQTTSFKSYFRIY